MDVVHLRRVFACFLVGAGVPLLDAACECDCAPAACDFTHVAIEVDDVEFYATADTWGSEHNFSDLASDADCDPGRRITVHRLDADATVSISGTLVAELSAPKRKTCTADISVTPSP